MSKSQQHSYNGDVSNFKVIKDLFGRCCDGARKYIRKRKHLKTIVRDVFYLNQPQEEVRQFQRNEEFKDIHSKALAWQMTLPLNQREQPQIRFPHQRYWHLAAESKDFFDKLKYFNGLVNSCSRKSPELNPIRLVAHYVCGTANWAHMQPACERSQMKKAAVLGLLTSHGTRQKEVEKAEKSMAAALQSLQKIKDATALDAIHLHTLARSEDSPPTPDGVIPDLVRGLGGAQPAPKLEDLRRECENVQQELGELLPVTGETAKERYLMYIRCIRLCRQGLDASRATVRALAKKKKLEKDEEGLVSPQTKEEEKLAKDKFDELNILLARLQATALVEKGHVKEEKERHSREAASGKAVNEFEGAGAKNPKVVVDDEERAEKKRKRKEEKKRKREPGDAKEKRKRQERSEIDEEERAEKKRKRKDMKKRGGEEGVPEETHDEEIGDMNVKKGTSSSSRDVE
jgi:hypothetical protein